MLEDPGLTSVLIRASLLLLSRFVFVFVKVVVLEIDALC